MTPFTRDHMEDAIADRASIVAWLDRGAALFVQDSDRNPFRLFYNRKLQTMAGSFGVAARCIEACVDLAPSPEDEIAALARVRGEQVQS